MQLSLDCDSELIRVMQKPQLGRVVYYTHLSIQSQTGRLQDSFQVLCVSEGFASEVQQDGSENALLCQESLFVCCFCAGCQGLDGLMMFRLICVCVWIFVANTCLWCEMRYFECTHNIMEGF